jgi:hypothetical protein
MGCTGLMGFAWSSTLLNSDWIYVCKSIVQNTQFITVKRDVLPLDIMLLMVGMKAAKLMTRNVVKLVVCTVYREMFPW